MRRHLAAHARLAKPDAVELASRNRESGLHQKVSVESQDPTSDDLIEVAAWMSFEDATPVLKAHQDGVIYSIALSEAGTTPPPVSSGIAFRSSSVGTANATSIVVSTPVGVVSGDALLAFLVIGGNAATITPPAGWTFVARVDNSNIVSLVTYWIAAGASPPSSYTWTGLNTPIAATILAYSGTNAAPIDTYNSQAGPGSTTNTPSSPAVTTSVNNDVVIRAYGVTDATNGASSISVTPPTGYTNRGQAQFSSGGAFAYTAEASDLLLATAGSSAAVNASTNVFAYYVSQTIAIKP